LPTLKDLDYPVQWNTSASFEKQTLPQALRLLASEQSSTALLTPGISVVFANSADLTESIAKIKATLATQPNTAVFITAVSPQHLPLEQGSPATNATVAKRLAVPLLTHNVTIYPERTLAQLNDLLPTAFSMYMSCADDNRSYSNGMHLNSPSQGYPRVASINPNIYLFETDKTSVLNADGDVVVYDNEGNIIEGGQPSTTVLIQGLNELQRFSTPQRKR